MKKSRKGPVREDRIHNEASVDAGPEEQALSWYYCLENKIRFPFQAECRAAKPLRSCAWHRTTSARTTCSSGCDGKVETWPSRSLNSSPSIQTNQPLKPSVTGITGS